MALCSDKVPPICLIITEKTIQVILFPFVNGLLENLVNAVVFEESYLFANGELDYTSLFTICRIKAKLHLLYSGSWFWACSVEGGGTH